MSADPKMVKSPVYHCGAFPDKSTAGLEIREGDIRAILAALGCLGCAYGASGICGGPIPPKSVSKASKEAMK